MSSITFVNVSVLTHEGVIGNSIQVTGQIISAINNRATKDDLIVDGDGGTIIPGLINSHDHLALNNFNPTKYRTRYPNARLWVEDIENRFDSDPNLIEPRSKPRGDRLLQGAIKNLLSGVTTVCHHDPDYPSLQGNFPLNIVRPYQYAHSLYVDNNVSESYHNTRKDTPWIIHLAEGTDAEAKAEFGVLKKMGAIRSNCIIVHGVALTPLEQSEIAEKGGGVIWCPGSNLFLLKQTSDFSLFNGKGKLALGSDSRLSGSFDLLEELDVARKLGQMSSRELFCQVTINPANMLNVRKGGAGKLAVGGIADLLLIPNSVEDNPYDCLAGVSRRDIDCVMLSGNPVITVPHMTALFKNTETEFEGIQLDGLERILAQDLTDKLKKSSVPELGLELVN